MYSSNNYVNASHQFPPTFYQYSSSCPPVISHDSDNNIFFHYYHHHLSPESSEAAAILAPLNDNPSGSAPTLNPIPEKVVKKDKHSKIFTAQGLRDRRVRLSTEIARQFFDLQDLLGYDKASETIAWLLMKCRRDIKNLVETKGNSRTGAMSLSPISKSEMAHENCEVVEDGDLEGLVSQDESLAASRKKKKKTFRGSFQLHRKVSRQKAKAEALERTREKMCGGRMKKGPEETEIIFEADEKSCPLKGIAEIRENSRDPIANQLPGEEIMEASIVTRRKKKPTSGLGYPNWDINDAKTASSCYRTATVNMSTELLISGKPWEVCTNDQIME